MHNLYGWFDGSCTPYNPGGYGGWGIVLKNSDNELIHKDGGKLEKGPHMSNNVAEYFAVADLLELIGTVAAKGWSVLIRGDSNLVINQMSGKWKVKKGMYLEQFHRAQKELMKLQKMGIAVTFEWVPREQNQEADELSVSAG
jgi:ribonuclease HI